MAKGNFCDGDFHINAWHSRTEEESIRIMADSSMMQAGTVLTMSRIDRAESKSIKIHRKSRIKVVKYCIEKDSGDTETANQVM